MRRAPAAKDIEVSDAAMRALALAVRHINASNGHPLSEVELLGWIRSGTAPADQTEQLRAFIDETDTATLQDLVLSGSASYAELAALADRLLPETHDTRIWLDDRRAF